MPLPNYSVYLTKTISKTILIHGLRDRWSHPDSLRLKFENELTIWWLDENTCFFVNVIDLRNATVLCLSFSMNLRLLTSPIVWCK